MTALRQYTDSAPSFKMARNKATDGPFVLDYEKLTDWLIIKGWRTPNTYSRHFAPLDDIPAVYLFMVMRDMDFVRSFVAYVGMSTRLEQRISGHPILAQIDVRGFHVQTWFRPTKAPSLRDIEKHYIGQFDPPFNVQGRPRGVVLE